MTRPRLAAAVAFAAALSLAACTNSAVDPGNRGDGDFVSSDGSISILKVRDRVPAPVITGRTLDGANYDISDDLGDVVVLNFWGSWCPPCRTEQATLNDAYDATAQLGAKFVGVDIRDDDSAARAFIRTHHVGYPSIVDRLGQLSLDFRPAIPATPPTTVVIDREGRVAARIIGGTSADGVLEPIIKQLAREGRSGA